jgi:hypothetical protein
MAIGDLIAVDGCPDLHYVDTGMYGVAKYGTVYVLDAERPAIVDAGLGTSTDLILDAMDAVGIAPEDLAVIALTHIHLDSPAVPGCWPRRVRTQPSPSTRSARPTSSTPNGSSRARNAPWVTSGSTTSSRNPSPRTASAN